MQSIIIDLFQKPGQYKKVAGFILVALLAAFPYIYFNNYYLHIAILVGIFVILSLSLNLITGFTGQLCLGHAAFYGVGAYVGALLMKNLQMNFFLALIVSFLVTGLFGLLLGIPTLRLRGDYLAIVTLGFGEIVRLVFINWEEVTNGPMGLRSIPAPSIMGFVLKERYMFYYLILIMVLLVLFLMNRLINSGFGMAMQTIKADEIAAESIGIYPVKYKLIAFILSSGLAGVAGCFYASYVSYISPTTFVYNTSVTILAMVVLGGLGSLAGSVIGAAVLTLIPEVLRFISDYRMLLFGALMVLMMIFKPEGFWGVSKRVKNIYKLKAGRRHHERDIKSQ